MMVFTVTICLVVTRRRGNIDNKHNEHRIMPMLQCRVNLGLFLKFCAGILTFSSFCAHLAGNRLSVYYGLHLAMHKSNIDISMKSHA